MAGERNGFTVNNPPKFWGLLFLCTLITILMLLNRIDEVAGAGILGVAMGYLAGNGVAAKDGTDPAAQPVFRDDHHHDDPEGDT